ncbi:MULTISPECIES: hypothetical protein [unclassified Vibrio]|jgi:hypothetical protein|uniref:hypothetical protein n=1 Tax=unclassified Vibrio TaxID=2614977 RepID=UPI0010BDF3A5|nr:hypothetical protein [Vibrio sp. F13]TKG29996.1 hypothetical protein FCV85_13470 [Vibrio sp. F13]
MDIETKLKLSQQQGKIIGIHEGMFVRFYDQALFAWQQWVVTPPSLPVLKVSAKVVKKLGSQCVLSGGLPVSSLAKVGVFPDEKVSSALVFMPICLIGKSGIYRTKTTYLYMNGLT